MGITPRTDQPRVVGWEDLRISAAAFRGIPGNEWDWEQVGTSGLYLPIIDAGEVGYFETQIPHGWWPGTPLRLHLHWFPSSTNTGTCNFYVEYQIKAIGGTYSATTNSNSGTDMYDAGQGTAYDHLVCPTHEIDTTGLDASACIFGKLTRVASGDTFTGDPYFMSMDIHYQRRMRGTVSEFSGR